MRSQQQLNQQFRQLKEISERPSRQFALIEQRLSAPPVTNIPPPPTANPPLIRQTTPPRQNDNHLIALRPDVRIPTVVPHLHANVDNRNHLFVIDYMTDPHHAIIVAPVLPLMTDELINLTPGVEIRTNINQSEVECNGVPPMIVDNLRTIKDGFVLRLTEAVPLLATDVSTISNGTVEVEIEDRSS